jgi:hypothetical protein
MEKNYLAKIDYRSSEASKIKNIFQEFLYKFSKIFKYIKSRSQVTELVENPYERFVRDEIRDCYDYFKKYFYNTIFFNEKKKIQTFSIQRALELNDDQDLYLEFGVWKGTTINFFSQFLQNNKIFGFDTFEGLSEDWYGHTNHPQGTFSLKGVIPKLNSNVIPVAGLIQKTLPEFLQKNLNKKLAFIHIDTDTYSTCKFILENIKDRLTANSIILFDEFYNYSGWKNGELKAFNEILGDLNYKFLAFNAYGTQTVVQIINKT